MLGVRNCVQNFVHNDMWPYRDSVGVRPLSPRPPSFIVLDRASKPSHPFIINSHPLFPGVYIAADHDYDVDSSINFLYTRNLVPGVQSLHDHVVVSAHVEDEHIVEYMNGSI
ncbi:hypothetical protein AgCh_023759 [Apium graveolens]